jgi:gamma-glutamyltranspeptidase/glutathione hydrolase
LRPHLRGVDCSSGRRKQHGSFGTHLASKVGVDVLKKGGNVIDAAVAVGYALAVVYPSAGNLGGGGFMIVQLADGRKTFLDFREKAPLAATADMYLDKDSNAIKGLSTVGHLAVGVPGTVSGLEVAREKYGTKKRAELIAPSIQLAERGFTLGQGDVDMLRTALIACHSRDENRSIVFHSWPPIQNMIQNDYSGLSLQARLEQSGKGWPNTSENPRPKHSDEGRTEARSGCHQLS